MQKQELDNPYRSPSTASTAVGTDVTLDHLPITIRVSLFNRMLLSLCALICFSVGVQVLFDFPAAENTVSPLGGSLLAFGCSLAFFIAIMGRTILSKDGIQYWPFSRGMIKWSDVKQWRLVTGHGNIIITSLDGKEFVLTDSNMSKADRRIAIGVLRLMLGPEE